MNCSNSVVIGNGSGGRRRTLEPLHPQVSAACSRARRSSPSGKPSRRHHRSSSNPVHLAPPPHEAERSLESPEGSRRSLIAWPKCPSPVKGEDNFGGAGSGPREWRRWGGGGSSGGGGGRKQHTPPRAQPDRLLMPPYAVPNRTFSPEHLLNGSEYDSLSQEIWEKFTECQQTEDTFNKKLNLWRFLYLSIKSIFPRYGLYLVGSTMSGFGLNTSDMDLCLYVRPMEAVDPRSHALVHLGFLLNYMKSFQSVLSNADLIQAKVPILRFRDTRHGIVVDLNCNNVVGIRNTNLLNAYSQLDWRVRPLVVAAKLWAQANNINDARHCTLSSYALTLMVLHYLQCGTSPPVLPCLRVTNSGGANAWDAPVHPPGPRNTCTLAELLLGFLKYYTYFQYDTMAVSIRAGRCISVAECRATQSLKNDPHQWKYICVEEPYDLTNTAHSVYDPDAFERILLVFRQSYDALSRGQRLQDVMPLAPSTPQHSPR